MSHEEQADMETQTLVHEDMEAWAQICNGMLLINWSSMSL